jgi:phospholipid/cholesterol/gamma-HCH transport system permease protein
MMVFAGVVGSAVTADLGARKVREELDAMSVLGVDVVRSLVVPRIVALTMSGVVIALVAVLVSVLANYAVAPAALGISPSLARDQLAYNIFPIDLYGAMGRGLLIGFLIGVVSCHKGLSCKGGAEGVGRAVNQTVMISFVLVWVTNSLFNTAFLPLFPESLVLRG